MKNCTPFLVLHILVYVAFICDISYAQIREHTIPIKALEAVKKDEYQCIATPIEELGGQFIVGYKATADIKNIHHFTAAICGQYNSNTTHWNCYHQQGNICRGLAKDLEGYSGGGIKRNGATYMFPEGAGIKLGRDEGLYNLVAEAHFKEPTKGTSIVGYLTFYLADYASMRINSFSTILSGYIPANAVAFSAEAACRWRGVEVFPYSFATHTHDRGYYAEGFRIRNGTWTVIGQGGPHINDKAIPNEKDGQQFSFIPGDVIATRCLYNNTETKNVEMGLDHAKEMCAIGMQFKYRPEDEKVYRRKLICMKNIQAFNWCNMKETKSRCSHN